MRRGSRDIRRLQRFTPGLYPTPELTQEQVAECLKRLRNDYCEGSVRDAASRFVPRPVAPRTAHIRVPEPIDISALLKGRPALEKDEVAVVGRDLRARMQAALDGINAELATRPAGAANRIRREPNPFWSPDVVRSA